MILDRVQPQVDENVMRAPEVPRYMVDRLWAVFDPSVSTVLFPLACRAQRDPGKPDEPGTPLTAVPSRWFLSGPKAKQPSYLFRSILRPRNSPIQHPRPTDDLPAGF